jgi:hypothetical protein
MIRVDVPDQKTFIDFPDSTSPEEMQRVLAETFPKPKGFIQKGMDVLGRIGSAFTQEGAPPIEGPGSPAAGEALMGLGTGLVAWPVGKVVGHAVQAYTGLGQAGGRKAEEGIIEGLTFQPRSEEGQLITGTVGKGLEKVFGPEYNPLKKGAVALGKVSPELGYVAETAADLLTAKGIHVAVKTVAAKIPDLKERASFVKDVTKEAKTTGKPVEEIIKEKMPEEVVSEPTPSPEPRLATEPTPTPEALEAQVKGGPTGELPKYAEGSAINLERLNTTEDVKQFINGMTKQKEAEIGKKTVTWEESRAQAEALGWDAKDVMKNSKSLNELAARVDAGRTFHMTMAEDLFNTLREMPADVAARTPEMRLQLLDKINNYGEVMKATSGTASEIGRALNIHKRMMASDPEFMQAAQLNKITNAILKDKKLIKVSDQLINDLQAIDLKDPAAIQKVIAKYDKASIGDMITEAWINALLSGVRTHEVNILSNALTFLSKPVMETPVAALMEVGKKSRNVFFGEVPAEVVGSWQGMKEGVKAAIKTYRTEIPSDIWSKIDVGAHKAIPSWDVTIGGKTFEIGGKQVRIPGRALMAADEFFKAVIYRADLNAQAYRMAAKEGLKGKARAEKTAELLDNPTEAMLEHAHTEARYRTFQAPLGRIGNALLQFRNTHKAFTAILPFMRTPINIIKFALERTPMNFAKIANDYRLGKITEAQLSAEVSKPIIGTMIGSVVYMYALEGKITGGGPKNKAEKDALLRTGWQPYSVKVGDNYYGYGRLEPIGTIFGMSADLADMTKMAGNEEKKKELLGRLMLSTTRNLSSKTWLQGVSGALDAIDGEPAQMQRLINQLAGSVIPTGVADIARSQDAVVRQTPGMVETIEARIPGMSKDLLPRRDIWGKEIERAGTAITRLASPVPYSEAKQGKADKELVRLDLHPSAPGKTIRGIELTPQEYDAYSEQAGKEARRRVENYVNGSSYPLIKDEIKKMVITRMIDVSRQATGSKIFAEIMRSDRARAMKPIEKKYGIQGGQ